MDECYNMRPGCAAYNYGVAIRLHKYCVLHTLSAETAQTIHVHILNTWITCA